MSATEGAPVDATPPADAARDARLVRFATLVDFVLAFILAISAVGTAWAGFQSAKWSGVQATAAASAGALRTEANRYTSVAGQQRTVDVVTFTQWLAAINQELGDDPELTTKMRNYEPNPETVSGFMYDRFRDEFKPAVEAWLDTQPLVNADTAPATPFEMPEYALAAEAKASELAEQADGKTNLAGQANLRSDNYVLTTVVFALSLFFSALVGRMKTLRTQTILTALALAAMLGALIVMATLPVELR